MALAKETVLQIIACHAQGMTVREIAKKAKLDAAQVEVCLLDNGKKPIYNRYSQVKNEEKGTKETKKTKRSYSRITDGVKAEVSKLALEGLAQGKIAKQLGISSGTVNRILNANKEKEPATAATVTDSQKTDVIVEDNTVSISKDTTGSQKSQALLKSIQKEFLGIYERLDESHQHVWDLGELYAQIKEAIGNEDT